MIYLTYSQRRAGSIAQARDFAESVTQMTVATITGLMIMNVQGQRAVFLDQMKNSSNIRELKVLRHSTIDAQFGAGQGGESQPSAVERAVMETGQARFDVQDDELRAVMPILNWSSYLGKNCMKCYEGREGLVLGAVSMRVSLQKTQADLRDFTWNISWLALGLSIPLLVAIFLLVRRYVVRPLGGEPADAAQVARRIASGDLSRPVVVAHGDHASLMAAMASMQEQLSALIGQVTDSARAIAAGMTQVAAGAQDLSQRTEEQATSLEETASAMEQITTAVTQRTRIAPTTWPSRPRPSPPRAARRSGRRSRTWPRSPRLRAR
jgi:methyl-accepting chemotaxis protein